MSKDLNMTILLDIYGSMLTDKQRDTLELYYEQDLSLGEIGDELFITRQGVLNCIKKSEAHLLELEEKLGLAQKLKEVSHNIDELEALIYQAEITNENELSAIEEKLVEIKQKL